MQTVTLRRYVVFTLASLFTAGVLTACGGGGSSNSGGSRVAAGKAALQGSVNSGIALNGSEQSSSQLLTRLFSIAISDAYASGVAGVTVELLKDGAVVASQMTDVNGSFGFPSLAPGNYILRLSQGAQSLGESPVIRLDPNTRTRLNLGMNGGILAVEVEAEDGNISGEVEDEQSSDDDNSIDDVSADDDESVDDVSEDDTSEDDVSEDDKSDDDCSDASVLPNCS